MDLVDVGGVHGRKVVGPLLHGVVSQRARGSIWFWLQNYKEVLESSLILNTKGQTQMEIHTVVEVRGAG